MKRANGDREVTSLREVAAYLNGVADAISALSAAAGEPTLGALSIGRLSSETRSFPWEPTRGGARMVDWGSVHPVQNSNAGSGRQTLPYGPPVLSPPSSSSHETQAVVSVVGPTGGAATTVDLASVAPPENGPTGKGRRRTLPYDAPKLSSSFPSTPELPWGESERSSEVRLRAPELPREWYDLADADAAAG